LGSCATPAATTPKASQTPGPSPPKVKKSSRPSAHKQEKAAGEAHRAPGNPRTGIARGIKAMIAEGVPLLLSLVNYAETLVKPAEDENSLQAVIARQFPVGP
jgi:hypothetical protein